MQVEWLKVDGTSESLPDTNLETLQKAVGGWIELVYTKHNDEMYINEEGKLHGLPINILATKLFGRDDVIVGDVVIVRRTEMN